MRIGLLGGSFNPAHDGHVHISRMALKHLRLDEVWWLVSPQNPLKSAEGMGRFEDRMRHAEQIAAADGRIRVSDLERRMNTRFTADSLIELVRRHPQHRFVWIMGADNLLQVHRWHRWPRIFHTVPVAVFARPTYSFRALTGKAASRFARYRTPGGRARHLADRKPPAWVFIWTRTNPQSATKLRAKGAGSPWDSS